MTVARLQGSTLQSSAYTQTFDKVWSKNIPGGSSQWSIVDNYTLKYTFWGVKGRDNGLNNSVSAVGIQTSCQGGYDLKYYIKTSLYTTGVSESSWTPSTELIYSGYNWNNHTSSDEYVIEFYVSRVDGDMLPRGIMYQTSFFVYGFTEQEVQEGGTTAIPSDWLDTTTQTYQTATTATRPAAYDDLVGTVPALTPDVGGTPPSWFEQYNPMEQPWFVDIIASLADFTDIVTSVAAQMQIFWVFGGFVITGLLLAWLLH